MRILIVVLLSLSWQSQICPLGWHGPSSCLLLVAQQEGTKQVDEEVFLEKGAQGYSRRFEELEDCLETEAWAARLCLL